jgi:ABC-type transport system substrate-binding protein
MDEAKRRELYRSAEDIVYADAPWLFLWFPEKYEVVSPRLTGYRIPLIFNGQRFLDVGV